MNDPDACTRCGTFLRGPDRLYSGAGDRLCPPCLVRDQDQTSALRQEDTVLISAYGAVLLAVGGALTSLFLPAIGRWLLVAASVSSWRALAAIKENAKLRAGLGAHLVPACLCALFSLALTGVCAALWLFGMASGEPS